MSDAKILQLTPPTKEQADRLPVDPRLQDIQHLIQAGQTFAMSIDEINYIMENYNELEDVSALSGLSVTIYKIFEMLDEQLAYIKEWN